MRQTSVASPISRAEVDHVRSRHLPGTSLLAARAKQGFLSSFINRVKMEYESVVTVHIQNPKKNKSKLVTFETPRAWRLVAYL